MGERKLTILYGSQTGTAQEVAERLWRESRRYHFRGPVMAMDDYPIQELIYERLVLFVCSTTGQGEEPDNMKRFWKFLLRKSLPTDSLKGLSFSVLGLGDSSYVHFNYASKKLNQRLLQLGGTALASLGLADDQHDLGADAAIDPWIAYVWSRLKDVYPLPDDWLPPDKNAACLPRWRVTVKQQDVATLHLLESTIENKANETDLQSNDDCAQSDKNSRSGVITVLSNTRTTDESHFQDVRLIEFSAPGLTYVPGDVLSVVPRNLPSSVDALLDLLSSNAVCPLPSDAVLHVVELDSDMPVPPHLRRPITLRECAERHWDLNAVPRRYLFQLLAQFTTSALEREKLLEFTTPAGQEDLYNYANRPRRTVLETLADFPHATQNVPVGYLFEAFQPIRPRAFSIASAPSAHRGQVHVLVAVVKYRTKLVTPRLGLCSNWMAGFKAGDKCLASVRSGSFKFPLDQKVPVIMIGPGTGVAPFRSFISEQVALGRASKDLLYLFFGCRNQLGDFHCRDDWLKMQKNSQLCMFCAFSRDQDHKIYVQHLIEKNSILLRKLIEDQNASIFLAGSAKNMPAAVKEAFVIHVLSHNRMGVEEATSFMTTLEAAGRYQCETWS